MEKGERRGKRQPDMNRLKISYGAAGESVMKRSKGLLSLMEEAPVRAKERKKDEDHQDVGDDFGYIHQACRKRRGRGVLRSRKKKKKRAATYLGSGGGGGKGL